MDDELTRDFKGIWIPKEIWLDNRLNTIDKILLLEVDSLDCGDDGCYASNEYLAKFCQCTEWTVSTSINKLIKLGYINVIKFDGRKRYIKSRLGKIQRQTWENPKADLGKSKDINIINNIEDINNNNNNIYDYLEENGFILSPIHYDAVQKWKDNDLTRFAIKKAVLNNKYNISYIEKILYNWEKNNITTVQQAIQQDEEFRKRANEYYKNKYKTKEQKDVPDWFDKDLKIDNEAKESDLTNEEKRLIDEILGNNK